MVLMPAPKRNCATEGCKGRGRYLGRLYLGAEDGRDKFEYLGYFCTKAHRREAQEAARAALRAEAAERAKPTAEKVTCDGWANRYLAKVEREQKASSLGTARQALKAFRAEFALRPIGSIEDIEAEDWINAAPPSRVPPVVTMFNYAVRSHVIPYNPFAGKGQRSRGRADQAPPTVKELERLLGACDALGDYADQMRALIIFGAYTGMRPGELYELRWQDIDLASNRITVSRRLYRGTIDVPKNGRPKTIALPPPARDVLLRQPTRAGELVFVSKQGKRLQASTVCQYWAIVRAAAGLDRSYDLYRCTKHLAVHRLYKLGLSKRAIAAQMGWSEDAVDGLLRIYGHADQVALEEVDALYEPQAERV
jgi:integrase